VVVSAVRRISYRLISANAWLQFVQAHKSSRQ
jgi:hypothetical protein